MIQLQNNTYDRAVGIILFIAAVLTVVTMAHHPTGHGGMLGPMVHGAMIALLSIQLFGYSCFGLRLGLDHPVILAALIAYWLNYLAHIIAATINGFIVPALAEHGEEIPHALFLLAWESNQAFARLGTVAAGVSFVLLGLNRIRRESGFEKVVGGLGILAGVLPVIMLIFDSTMDVRSAFVMYGIHSVFLALIGLLMIRSNVRRVMEGLV